MFNTSSGVKAQPTSIKSPSTITTISSYLSGISSYVSSHSPSSPLINQQEATARGPEKVICVKFCRVDWWGTSRARLCLLLGYARGFQVWVVDDIEDVREVISVRDGLGSVKWLDAVPNPKSVKEAKDYLEASRPVMAYITNANPATARPDNPASPSQSALQIYSLRSQAVVQTIRFSDDVAMDAKCNDRVIVVAMRSNTLQLYSALTLHQLAVYTDVASPIVFDIGSQFLIYATTTAVPPTRANSEDDESDEDAYNDMTQGLARQVAGKVAKELVGGAKVLGEMSARAISNYFGKEGNGAGTKKDVKMERRPSSGGAVGVVVVRRFPSPTVHSSSTSQDIAHAHWRPHNNPVSIITFDTSQALILTASTQANTFYIWALPGVPRQGTPRTVVKCLYKLERGYTMATVESASFDLSSRWCSVTTQRGTTHVYRIDLSDIAKKKTVASCGGLVGGPSNAVSPIEGNSEGPISIYPATRIKRAGSAATNENDAVPSAAHPLSSIDAVVDVPAPHLVTAFLPPSSSSSTRQHPHITRQRMLTFHPMDPRLVLHHLETSADAEPQLSPNLSPASVSPKPVMSSSNGSATSSSLPVRFSPPTTIMERFSPSSLLPGMNSVHRDPPVRSVDLMEWKVCRHGDWAEVKKPIAPSSSPTAKKSRRWEDEIELETCVMQQSRRVGDIPSTPPPIWLGGQFVLKVLEHPPSTLESCRDASKVMSKTLPTRFQPEKPYGNDTPTTHHPRLQVHAPDDDLDGNLEIAMEDGLSLDRPSGANDSVTGSTTNNVDEEWVGSMEGI